MVKGFLSQRNISFEERDVSQNQAYARELISATGQMGVPVTIIDGQTVIGFDQSRLEQLTSQRKSDSRPSLGASIADAKGITARQSTGITSGAYIGKVRPGSIAERLGLVPGDIIKELNMQPVNSAGDLEKALSGLDSGSRVSLTFLRGNNNMTAEGTFQV